MGYILKKDQLDAKTISQIKKDLTVKPIVLQAYKDFVKPVQFGIFLESPNYLYVPRYYGIEKFGPPKKNYLQATVPINCKFIYDLLPHQHTAYNKTLSALHTYGGGLLQLYCGGGKCLGKGTQIMMYNGMLKRVEDVIIGDKLMGDDGICRNVQSLATGLDELYSICPTHGESWVCNKSHILVLKDSIGQIYDISVEDLLHQHPDGVFPYTLYKTRVEFPHIDVFCDPYWTGFCYGMYSTRIPFNYQRNSCVIRLQLLAGIIDAMGQFMNNHYYITTYYNEFADDLLSVCNSLGYYSDKKIIEAPHEAPFRSMIMCRIFASDIPVRVCLPTNQSAQLNGTTFKITPHGYGEYYGFEIDGNGRFLLSDFTVTHNTAIAIKLATDLRTKTLVVVNKECLMDQWSESICKFTGGQAKIGIIQQSKVDVDDKDFVIAMLHSIAQKDYPKEIFQSFGFCILDECHHLGSEVFSQSLPKIASLYMLGLSATPVRKDGLSHVFHKYIGELCHSERRKGSNRVLIKRFKLNSSSPMYETLFMSNGIKNTVGMLTNLSKCVVRTQLIIKCIRVLMKQDRKILLLSGRREHLEQIHDLLSMSNIQNVHGNKITFGYYRGNQGDNKKKHKQMLLESAKCDVVLGTYSIACLSDQTNYINYITGEEMTLCEIANDNSENVAQVAYNQQTNKYDVIIPRIELPVINLNQTTNKFGIGVAIDVGYTKPKPCFSVTHELGRLVASHDHKFYTQRGWVPTEQLQLTDYLISDKRVEIESCDIISLTGDVLQTIGETVDKCIPTELMFLPEHKITYLLQGLFSQNKVTCDMHQGYCIYFKTHNLRYQTIFLLKRLGIQAHVMSNACVNIPLNDLPLFEQIIYSHDVMTLCSSTEKQLIPIKSINFIEKWEHIRLCDMSVHNNHNLLLSGILVSNSEGLDIPDLNTEIMATPVSDVEQTVGRILRKYHDKVNPLVVDLIDSCGNFARQGSTRAKFYKDEDYEIQDYKLSFGDDVRDIEPFLPEVKKYLLDNDLKRKTYNPEKDEDDISSDNESIKKIGRCLLDDDNETPQSKQETPPSRQETPSSRRETQTSRKCDNVVTFKGCML